MKRALERMLVAARRERASLVAAACVVAAACLLKRFYAHAGADELGFVLAPSCWLAAHAFGVALVFEPGQGYVAHAAHLIVGAACAGVNFLVVCWLSLFFTGHARHARLGQKLAFGALCFGLAYLATALANGTRIALAAQLAHAGFYGAVLTHERVHRLLGVVVYCALLLMLCSALAGRARYLVPLGCYLAVAIVLPLSRHALGAELAPGVFPHVLETGVEALAVALAAWLLHRLFSAHAPRARHRDG